MSRFGWRRAAVMAACLGLILGALPASAPPPVRAAAVSGYYLDSVPGDGEGPGYPTVWSWVGWSASEIGASGGISGVVLSASPGGGPSVGMRDFQFREPSGASLVVGKTYSGIEWNGCTPEESSFVVRELSSATPRHLAISFSVRCGPGYPLFLGELRYESAVPLRALTLDASAVTFAPAAVGATGETKTIVIGSRGSDALTISSIALSPATPDFAIVSQTCTVAPVAAGGTCEVKVRFTPKLGGWRTATLAFKDNTTRAVHSIGLRAPTSLPVAAAGWYHSCALKTDGTLTCWGDSEDGATSIPGGTYKAVSAGQAFTCAIRPDGTLACWGWNGNDQALPPAGTFTAVSAGGNHACAIRSDGTIVCWGYNEYAQAMPPAGTFTDVSAGFRHTCGVLTDGGIDCWGDNDADQAVEQEGPFLAVSAGTWHTCGIRASGIVTCWGADDDGQASPPTGTFSAVSAGGYHTCALRTNGTLACWGFDGDGQASPPAGTFLAVSAGAWHSCAIRTNGTPVCWGWNYYNQATTSAPAATTYVPVAPTRLLDSRSGIGLSGKFKANTARTFQVAGRGPVPANAVAVTGNLTVTRQTAKGYGSLTPVATNTPSTSTLNFPMGDNRANNVTVALGPGGRLGAVYKAAAGQTSDFIFDVTGYFLANETGATYKPVDPVRLLDTRAANGLNGKFTSGTPRTWSIAGRGGIPTNATAITGNLTVTGQTSGGYVAVGPVSTARPTTSTLNFPLGDTRANGLTVKLATNGTLSAVYVAGAGKTTHILLDVTGYYVAGLTGAKFYPLAPDRVLDSRYDIGLEGKFTANSARTLATAARVGVPADAIAVTGNLTVVGQTKGGYVSMTRTTTGSPTTSTLNFPAGDTRANGVTGPLTPTGTVGLVYRAAAGSTTNLLLDVTGYFR